MSDFYQRFFYGWPAYRSRPSSLHIDIAAEAIEEFESLADYIFKSPRFLESEERLERKKLEIYFPESNISPENRKWRSIREYREFTNIYGRFPIFLKSANLLIATSLMEHHVARLLAAHYAHLGKSFEPHRGLDSLIQDVAANRPNFQADPHFVPVRSAIKIRNRLVHDGGRLTSTRKCEEIRNLISDRLHTTDYHKEHWVSYNPDRVMVWIERVDGFDWIRMHEDYAFQVVAYFRSFYLEICLALDPID